MRRREFIRLAGGAAVAWPLAVRAQQPDRVRRVGILMGFAEADAEAQSRLSAFKQALQKLGWSEGRNVQFEYRWAADVMRMREYSAELVAAAPDAILASTVPVAQALKRVTSVIPIVFASGGDPVTTGLVASLARPGGNITGFSATEPSLAGKWLELLKELAPSATRIGVIHAPENPVRADYLRSIASANVQLNVEMKDIDANSDAQIAAAVDTLASGSISALLILPGASTALHRRAILAAAERHRLPSIYPFRYFAADGGLVSYGVDSIDLFRRAAGYVDRILRGTKPTELPVQMPTKFELVVNLRASKLLGIEVPSTLLARADEVIE